MPRTLAEIRRIAGMHANGQHDRCEVTKCKAAMAQAREIEPIDDVAVDEFEQELACQDRGLFDELTERGIDPRKLVGYYERAVLMAGASSMSNRRSAHLR